MQAERSSFEAVTIAVLLKIIPPTDIYIRINETISRRVRHLSVLDPAGDCFFVCLFTVMV